MPGMPTWVGGLEGLNAGSGPNVKSAKPKKMMMTSTGMLRKVSTYSVASLRTIQFVDSRPIPTKVPSVRATTMATTQTAAVLRIPTQSSDHVDELGSNGESRTAKPAGASRKSKACRDALLVEVCGQVGEEPSQCEGHHDERNGLGCDPQEANVTPERRPTSERRPPKPKLVPPRNFPQKIVMNGPEIRGARPISGRAPRITWFSRRSSDRWPSDADQRYGGTYIRPPSVHRAFGEPSSVRPIGTMLRS